MLSTDGRLAKPRVLVAEDSPQWRQFMRELLRQRGYQVVGEVGTAVEALDFVKGRMLDCALIDAHLPDGDGFELAARLSASKPRIAILLTSAGDDDSYHVRSLSCGARGFVPKENLARVDLAGFLVPPTPLGT